METQKYVVNVSGSCFDFVPVSSEGLWNVRRGESILQHSLFRLHVELILMVSFSAFFRLLLKSFYMPQLTSDILAGMILGPTVLGRFFSNASNLLFPTVAPNQVMASLSKIGCLLFTFLAGVRMKPSLAFKTGKTAIVIGFLLFVIPHVMLNTAEVKYDENIPAHEGIRISKANFALIYITEMTTTQFVGVTYILRQLKITNSRLGHFALASSLISEMGRAAYARINRYQIELQLTSLNVGLQSIFFYISFVLLILFPLRNLMFALIQRTPQGQPVKEIYTSITITIVFFLSSIGDSAGINYLHGPFIFGLAVPAGTPLAEFLVAKFDTAVSGFLTPLMVTFSASKFDLWQFFDEFNQTVNFQTAFAGFCIKLVLTFTLLLCCKIPLSDASALTIILNAKGVQEIGILLSYGQFELKDLETSSGVFLIFLLSIFQPAIVKKLYDPAKQYIGHQKKCMQYSANEAELQILACAHRQDDAMAALKLLALSNPSKQSAPSIYGICLVEQLSSATPHLINHQLGQKTSSSTSASSRSQPIIDIFRYFSLQHRKMTHVHVFTAVSQVKHMHEDICWLAFDKTCSLIILPFHKKWNSNGHMVTGNPEFRNLNINILERAPCSVGILMDRHTTNDLSSIFEASTTFRVATLFIGGADDREALAYALWMARNPQVQLTVMRITAPQAHVDDEWETILDNESLRNMKHEILSCSNINYIEEMVADGSDTANVVKSMQVTHDLIMVGRRHRTEPEALSGMTEWTELPELGPLGDLLASSDVSHAVSVLVVQQQIMQASHSSVLN